MNINKQTLELGVKPSCIRNVFSYARQRAAEIGEENVFDYSLGNPSVAPPEEINQTVKELLDKESSVLIHGYTMSPGDLNVRKTIAQNINERFNQNLTFKNIYMTCGAAASLTITLKAILNAGEEVIAFAPFFPEYSVFTENAGGKLVVSEPEEGTLYVDLKDFESRITKKTRAVIINSPNNPSGVVYLEYIIKGVCEILNKKQKEYGETIYLICDEPYRELVYDDLKVPYIMDYYDNSFVCYSFSKALSLPGERIGYIATNPKMDYVDEVFFSICGAGRSLGYVCAPSLFQQVIAKNINAKVDVNVYKENRDILYNALLTYGYTCVHPDGAFYLLVKTFGDTAIEFCETAKKFELMLVPCDDFCLDGYVRLAYCCDKQKIINSLPAFEKLAKFYKK